MAAWRPGNWCFAVHPFLTLRPHFERQVGYFASWWLWFEISYADGAKIDAHRARQKVRSDGARLAKQWVVRLRVERGNAAGWEDCDFPFFSRAEAEAFIFPALLANNVIFGRRMWEPFGDEQPQPPVFQKAPSDE